jgi:hypothetical protein
MQLRRNDGARHRGIHIANNEHEIRFLLKTYLLELDHDARGLLGMRA